MGLLVFVLGGLAFAVALRGVLGRLPDTSPYATGGTTWILEWASSTALLALATWVAGSWILALTHCLRPGPLIVLGAIELAVGGAWIAKHWPRGAILDVRDRWGALSVLIVLAPVLLWTAFVSWRGTLLPVYNHDGLSYHLPKAVLLLKNGGFGAFDVPEPRIATWPWNYELLLSDVMQLTGDDHLTASISTFSFVAFLLFAARLAAGWWGDGPHVGVLTALAAACPIVVLHSGLHKTDLLVAVLTLAALLHGARWFAVGCTASAALAAVAVLLSIGTKVNGFFVALAVAPLLFWGAWRRRERFGLAGFALACAALVPASILFGAWSYCVNLWRLHRLILVPPMIGGTGYGDWSNLWLFTYLALVKPFGPPQAVWNPFAHAYWWWPSNDVWQSHFGVPFSLGALLLLPCVWRYRTRGARTERAAASLAALAIFAMTVPIRVRPVGYFATSGRYLVAIVPVVLAWTVCPILVDLDRARRWRPYLLSAVALGVAFFVGQSVLEFGVHDQYAPLEWVKYEMDHPDDRTPFARRNRAGNVFDAVAGERETCAVDVGFDTWVYPAYGRHWTRKVEFLDEAGDASVPDDANWVLVDRSWNVFFGHPAFTDTGKAFLIGRGQPTDSDLRVYRRLRDDARFRLVYDDRAQNQALFRREPASTPRALPR